MNENKLHQENILRFAILRLNRSLRRVFEDSTPITNKEWQKRFVLFLFFLSFFFFFFFFSFVSTCFVVCFSELSGSRNKEWLLAPLRSTITLANKTSTTPRFEKKKKKKKKKKKWGFSLPKMESLFLCSETLLRCVALRFSSLLCSNIVFFLFFFSFFFF
jgi:hypothetical protein